MNPNTSLEIFDFNESPVRVSVDPCGAPWFVAADVCRVLEISNSRDAVASLDEDERMTVANTDGHPGQRGGAQSYNLLSESGLYALIFKSRKAEARAFRKWVTKEVLPSIRKTGGYSISRERLDREERQIDSMIGLIGSVLGQRADGKINNQTLSSIASMAAQYLRAWEIKLRVRTEGIRPDGRQ